SIDRLSNDQRQADEQLTIAQRRLFEAREAIEDLNRRAAEAGAAHAALVERASAIAAEVERLEEAASELNERCGTLAADLAESRVRVEALQNSIVSGETQLALDVQSLDALRARVMT